MSRLKVAVVGVGALGRHHARILDGLENAELVAVADSNPTRGQQVSEQCGTAWVADFRQLFDGVDAASIAVPTTAHLPVASEFLRRGIPVLVEKPLAGDLNQATELVELAEQSHTLLQVGHVERFNPATGAAWSLAGRPKYIRAERLSPYAFRSMDIGVVHDVMIHDLDLILDLVDSPVRRVEAFGISILGGHEDAAQAHITFENGCIADVTANRVNPEAKRTMQIWSPEGAVAVDFHARTVVRYKPSPRLLFGESPLARAQKPGADIEQLKRDVFGQYLEVERPHVAEADALTAELASFVDCVLHGRKPLVGGEQALAAMQLAHQVLESVASHQWDGHAAGAVGPHPAMLPQKRLAG